MGCLVLGFQRAGFLTWTLTASNFNALQSHSNAGKKVIDTQCTFVLFSGMFACTEPRSATRKSRSPLLAPLPFTPSSHSNLFFSEVCALFSLTAVSQPFVYQSLRHSFHRDRGAHPSSQELCALFASCSSPLPVPKPRRPLPLRASKSRRINTCKSLSKQRTLTSFGMIDLQKTGGGGAVMVNQPNRPVEFPAGVAYFQRQSAVAALGQAPSIHAPQTPARWRSPARIRRAPRSDRRQSVPQSAPSLSAFVEPW